MQGGQARVLSWFKTPSNCPNILSYDVNGDQADRGKIFDLYMKNKLTELDRPKWKDDVLTKKAPHQLSQPSGRFMFTQLDITCYSQTRNNQWDFQNPKMEILYHYGDTVPFFPAIFCGDIALLP